MQAKLKHGLIRLAKAVAKPPLHLLLRLEQEEKRSETGGPNELAFMYAFLFKHLARTAPRRILDVGTGTSSLPHLLSHCGATVLATDKFEGYWARRPLNRHFWVAADDICNSRLQGRFDMVTCVDVIQHIPNHLVAIKTMASLLRPGGCIVIGCFYNERQYVPDVYRLPESNAFGRKVGYGCQILSHDEIEGWVEATGLNISDHEFWDCFSGKYWSFGKRLSPPRSTSRSEKHHAICLCLTKPPLT